MAEVKLNDIKNFLVLGSGTLGLRVALQAAISGFNTTVYDISDKALDSGKNIQIKILKSLIKSGHVPEADFDGIISRLAFTSNPEEAAKNVDFVNESVTEEPEIKEKVWKQFGELCPSHTVFTTNTSYLLPSMFSEATGRPGMFCAFHFHDVFTARVVDIMPHPGTESWMIELLDAMGKKLNQIPVRMKRENPGYIFNTMLMAFLGAAGALVTYDIAAIEDVDRSWMGNFSMPAGPFGIMDQIGLDTAWHVTHKMKDTKSQKFAELLKGYIDQGKLGIKTGEGFYNYPNPSYQSPEFLK
ncbi:MAG: 3-hydroxyacyl-CoA dehydrogenase [Cyclobacteriaceae bacterium]